jgi:quinol monooxygenase YgiN
MSIYRTASFQVRRESLEQCKEGIRQYVAEIRDAEPGMTVYVSLQDQINPTHFVHFYAFADEKAEALHAASEVTKRFAAFLGPELSGPVAFGDFQVIAEK